MIASFSCLQRQHPEERLPVMQLSKMAGEVRRKKDFYFITDFSTASSLDCYCNSVVRIPGIWAFAMT